MRLMSYISFFNGKKRPDEDGNIPIYGGNGILGYCGRSNMRAGIIIGRVGAYCGSVFLSEKPCWVSDNAIKAIVKEGNDEFFFYYLLKSLRLNERHIGTSQPLITQDILNSIDVTVPDYDKQRTIGSILRILDSKIETNKQINENLAA